MKPARKPIRKPATGYVGERPVPTLRMLDSKIAALAKIGMASKDPRKAMSLSVLIEAQGVIENRKKSKPVAVLNSKASQKAAQGAKRRNAKLRREQRMAEKAAEKSRGLEAFRGQREKIGLLPQALECIAAWPDEPSAGWPDVGHSSMRAVLLARGWVAHDGRKPNAGAGELQPGTNSARTCAPAVWWITEEGRAARAFARWWRARAMLGHDLPSWGSKCRLVPFWMRGADIPMGKGMRNGTAGFYPGDPPDDAWPDFGRFALEETWQ